MASWSHQSALFLHQKKLKDHLDTVGQFDYLGLNYKPLKTVRVVHHNQNGDVAAFLLLLCFMSPLASASVAIDSGIGDSGGNGVQWQV